MNHEKLKQWHDQEHNQVSFSELFQKGYSVDCSAYVKRKGRFDYLDWQSAYRLAINTFGNAVYNDLQDEVHPDGTVTVRAELTIQGHRREMFLPVLDYNNKAITNPGSKDLNDSRQRCRVKVLSLFGLGFHVYEGKAQPEDTFGDNATDNNRCVTPEQIKELRKLVKDFDSDVKTSFLRALKIEKIQDLPERQFDAAINMIKLHQEQKQVRVSQ